VQLYILDIKQQPTSFLQNGGFSAKLKVSATKFATFAKPETLCTNIKQIGQQKK
jgi:hypothetical protein